MKTKKQKIVILTAIGILLLAVVFGVVIWRTSISSKSQTSQTTASDSTKGEISTTGSSSTVSSSSATSSNDESGAGVVDKNGDATVQTTAYVAPPTGTFVSNHHVSLSDSSQLSVQSDCTTTPGIACKITFANGSITKNLAAKTTDAGGAAYWSWNVKDLGLTVGSWQVSAIATVGSQTQTSIDATKLEINQ